MKIYITHYSKNGERRMQLFNKLRAQTIIDTEDVVWVKKWDKEDLFVRWVKWASKSDQNEGHLSLILKHIWCMHDMVEKNVNECIILEDDVVFEDDWLNKVKKIDKGNIKFLKLGSIFKNLKYDPEKIYTIHNPGGTEALWIHQDFARVLLKNIEFRQTIDIYYAGVLQAIRHPILCVPVCSQTSVYEDTSTLQMNACTVNWIDYIENFHTYKKFTYEQILSDFEKFKTEKENFEKNYKERYNYNLELKDFNYLKL
jgi:GR25 family glycosyltransferase involved in LPS biosynthesis